MYKAVLNTPDGEVEDDEVFETEEEARAYALVMINDYTVGREVLHLSNPGDNPPLSEEDDRDIDFDVIEVDASA